MADNLKDLDKQNFADDDEYATVTLTLDDGSELECEVVAIFPAGKHEYIALIPLDQIESEDGDVYIYRFNGGTQTDLELENIDDDDEFEIAADAFDELLDNQEFDELFGE